MLSKISYNWIVAAKGRNLARRRTKTGKHVQTHAVNGGSWVLVAGGIGEDIG